MTNYIAAYEREDGEALRLAASLTHDATIADGVMRWNSNGRVPPEDCLLLAYHLCLPIDLQACRAARDAETQAFLAAYRKARTNGPTAEERAEARAAHGPGVVLVDVITGQRFRT